MKDYLSKLGIKDIVTVLAKEFKIKIKGQYFVVPSKNLKKLIKLSFDKCKNSGYPSFKKSLTEKIFDNILTYYYDIYKRIYSSIKNINLDTSNSNLDNLIISLKNNLFHIICGYLEKQKSDEICNIINQNVNDFIQNLYDSDQINYKIQNYKSDFFNKYMEQRNSIISRYNVYNHEIYYSINNNSYAIIEKMVIGKILSDLSDRIFVHLNNSIINFIKNEIKSSKRLKIFIKIPDDLINNIQKISDTIYKELGNISDDEDDELSIQNSKFCQNGKSRKNINYLINDEE